MATSDNFHYNLLIFVWIIYSSRWLQFFSQLALGMLGALKYKWFLAKLKVDKWLDVLTVEIVALHKGKSNFFLLGNPACQIVGQPKKGTKNFDNMIPLFRSGEGQHKKTFIRVGHSSNDKLTNTTKLNGWVWYPKHPPHFTHSLALCQNKSKRIKFPKSKNLFLL